LSAKRPRYTVPALPISIALLRGINIGGHRKIKMNALRSLCESLGFQGVQTYLQSGNIIFRWRERNTAYSA